MKKILPLIAFALIGQASVYAADIKPQILSDMSIDGISPNGEWAVSTDAATYNTAVLNLVTGEVWNYGESYGTVFYSSGIGRCVSNDGVVVASGYSDDLPYYWKDGKWAMLPIGDDDYAAYPNAITPDGSRIAGQVMKSAFGSMEDMISAVPVIWNLNAEGEYDMYEALVYPTKDLTGRAPQYVLLDDINADGTVIGGCIVDYSGGMILPLVYTQNADGDWAYDIVQEQLLNPDNLEFPPYPGEAPSDPKPADYMTPEQYDAYMTAFDDYFMRPSPEPEDYISSEGLENYLLALDDYLEDPDNNPWVSIYDYMTPEEYDAYQAAVDAYWDYPYPQAEDYMSEEALAEYNKAQIEYEKAYNEWYEKIEAFDNVFFGLLNDVNVPAYEMNSARISQNGQYYLLTTRVAHEDPNSWFGYTYTTSPMVFDLVNNTYKTIGGIDDVYGNGVTDKGGVYGGSPSDDYVRDAYVSTSIDEPMESLVDYIAKEDKELYTWVKENLTREFVEFSWEYNPAIDDWEEVMTVEEKCLLGTPVASANLTVFCSWIPNKFDLDNEAYFYSYVLPIKGGQTGIGAITEGKSLKVKAERGGVITIDGQAENVSVFDMSGRRVFTLDNPSAKVATGLGNGVYVVKATNAQGRASVVKITF